MRVFLGGELFNPESSGGLQWDACVHQVVEDDDCDDGDDDYDDDDDDYDDEDDDDYDYNDDDYDYNDDDSGHQRRRHDGQDRGADVQHARRRSLASPVGEHLDLGAKARQSSSP